MRGLLSQLEAVNAILAVTGDSPVADLEDTYEQAHLALQELERESRRIQSMGFWFNKEHNVQMKPNTSQEVIIPRDCLHIIPYDSRYIQRNLRLYDKQERTYRIPRVVDVQLITFLQWEDLPNLARQAILASAKVSFNSNFHGDESIVNYLLNEKQETMIELRTEDTRQQKLNIHYDNKRINNIIFRNRRGRL